MIMSCTLHTAIFAAEKRYTSSSFLLRLLSAGHANITTGSSDLFQQATGRGNQQCGEENQSSSLMSFYDLQDEQWLKKPHVQIQ